MKFDETWVDEVYDLFNTFFRDTREYRQKCTENEKFYRAQHWDNISPKEDGEPRPVTPVIFSTLENMLSDIMDAYPEPIILGQEVRDDDTAHLLGKYVNYILKRRNYRSVFRDSARELLKKGTCIQEVFWDNSLYGGIGDINIKKVDIENFLWDDRVSDIQKSKGLFKFYFYPREWFTQRYGDIVNNFKAESYEKLSSSFDDNEFMLIEYWYKSYDKDTKKEYVHMARLAGKTLLYASEKTLKNGIYEHGEYPFIVEKLYPLSGKITGLSVIDMFKNSQMYADKLDQIIIKNALLSGKMKMLVNRNSEIDEESLLDMDCELVRGNRIDDASVRWFQPLQLSPSVMAHYNNKLASIKEESGQNLFNRGETGNGITAASAIMALQEAGSKRSRLIIDGIYDGFESLVKMIIELIRENYTEQRYFRIEGKQESIGANSLMRNNGYLEFDITINVQKQAPYKTAYQNELALSLLQLGVIAPVDALGLMTFEGKDKILPSVIQMQKDAEDMAKTQAQNEI